MKLLRLGFPLLVLFLIGVSPSCKKNSEGEPGDTVSSDTEEKPEKATDAKKAKKAKAKAKKKKVEPSQEAGEAKEEANSDSTAKSRTKKSNVADTKNEEPSSASGDVETRQRGAKPGTGKVAKTADAGEPAAKAAGQEREGGDAPAQEEAPLHSLPPNVLAPSDAAAPPASRVGVARLLTNTDLNSQLPMKGWAGHGPVPGIPPSEFYNSILYKIPNTSAFAAIQVWDFDTPSMSLDKWNEVQQTYPNVEPYAEGFVKDSVYSYRNQVKTFAFHEPKLSMVVVLSCYVQACEDSALYQLSELVFARLQTK